MLGVPQGVLGPWENRITRTLCEPVFGELWAVVRAVHLEAPCL